MMSCRKCLNHSVFKVIILHANGTVIYFGSVWFLDADKKSYVIDGVDSTLSEFQYNEIVCFPYPA